MRPAVFIGLLAGTLLSGLLIGCGCGFLLARFYYDDEVHWQRRQQVADTVSVLVAVVDIPSGTVIGDPEKFFTLKEFLADTAPPDFLLDVEQVRGKVAQRAIEAGQACRGKDFADILDLANTPLPAGTRALTIKVAIDRIEGFIPPGSRIDLVCIEPHAENPKVRTAKVVVQDVLVLAVSAGAMDRLFTVAVSAEEAAKLQAAAERGPISVLVRKPGE